MSKKIVVVGAGSDGKSVAGLLLLQNDYELVGFLDDAYPKVADVWGFPVLGKVSAEALQSFKGNVSYVVVAIGNKELPEMVFKLLNGLGFSMSTLVHPNAFVSPWAIFGNGCMVRANEVIGTEERMGEGVIVNSGTIVDHHVVVDEFGHLGVNASIAGGTHLGRSAWAQAGVALGYGVSIPERQILTLGESR